MTIASAGLALVWLTVFAPADAPPPLLAPATIVDPLAPSTGELAAAAALSGAGGALGGLAFPAAVFGATFASAAALQATASLLPPPRDFAQAEGQAVCLIVPFMLFVILPLELIGAGIGLGVAFGLAFAGALPAGRDAALAAGGRAVAGACTGCALGWCGMCGYMTATSRTVGAVTTFGQAPYPQTLIFMTTLTSLGAASFASAPLVADALTNGAPDERSMAY